MTPREQEAIRRGDTQQRRCAPSPNQGALPQWRLRQSAATIFSHAKRLAKSVQPSGAEKERLIELELVEKRENIGKVTFFAPRHPKQLKELADRRKVELEQSSLGLRTAFGLLVSQFNALQDKPNIRFYEGEEGIKEVYGDILKTGTDIMIITSPIHEGRQEVLHLIKEQVKKQAEQNIKTRAITPHHEGKIAALPVEEDEKHLITRKIVPTEKLNIPVQIIVYGDKVAITNFKESLITVLVESKYIAETFRIMFEYMWERS